MNPSRDSAHRACAAGAPIEDADLGVDAAVHRRHVGEQVPVRRGYAVHCVREDVGR